MSCKTLGRFKGPFIADPYIKNQIEMECKGTGCSVNGSSCVVDMAIVDCCVVDDIPDGFPVDY